MPACDNKLYGSHLTVTLRKKILLVLRNGLDNGEGYYNQLNAVCFVSLKEKRKTIFFDNTLEGDSVAFPDEIKYLGINITNDLNRNKQVNSICNKAFKTLGLFRRNLAMCPTDIKMQA